MAEKRITFAMSHIAESGNVCHKTVGKCQRQPLSAQRTAILQLGLHILSTF